MDEQSYKLDVESVACVSIGFIDTAKLFVPHYCVITTRAACFIDLPAAFERPDFSAFNVLLGCSAIRIPAEALV